MTAKPGLAEISSLMSGKIVSTKIFDILFECTIDGARTKKVSVYSGPKKSKVSLIYSDSVSDRITTEIKIQNLEYNDIYLV